MGFQEIINSNQPVLVDFFATWCGPCQTMEPVLKNVSEKMEGKARVLKIDVEKNKQLASLYKVMGVPTLIIFKEGKVVWRQSGVVLSGELVNLLNQHI